MIEQPSLHHPLWALEGCSRVGGGVTARLVLEQAQQQRPLAQQILERRHAVLALQQRAKAVYVPGDDGGVGDGSLCSLCRRHSFRSSLVMIRRRTVMRPGFRRTTSHQNGGSGVFCMVRLLHVRRRARGPPPMCVCACAGPGGARGARRGAQSLLVPLSITNSPQYSTSRDSSQTDIPVPDTAQITSLPFLPSIAQGPAGLSLSLCGDGALKERR